MKNQIISVKGNEIRVISKLEEDYISITDIARHKNPEEPKDIVKNWMQSKATIEFLGLWEKLHNPDFKGDEFDSFMYQDVTNAFVLSPSKCAGALSTCFLKAQSVSRVFMPCGKGRLNRDGQDRRMLRMKAKKIVRVAVVLYPLYPVNPGYPDSDNVFAGCPV